MVCGDMLLMHNANWLYCLNMSIKPAVWMVVEKLNKLGSRLGGGSEERATFLHEPGTMGHGAGCRRSNIVYFTRKSQTWISLGYVASRIHPA